MLAKLLISYSKRCIKVYILTFSPVKLFWGSTVIHLVTYVRVDDQSKPFHNFLCVTRWSFSYLFLSVKPHLPCDLDIWLMDALSCQAAEINRALLAALCLALFLRKFKIYPISYWNVAQSAPTGPALELFAVINSTSSVLQKSHLNTRKISSVLAVNTGRKVKIFVFNQQMTTWTPLPERDRPVKLLSFKGKYVRSQRTLFGKGCFQEQRSDPMSGCGPAGLALMETPGVNQNWIPTSVCIVRKSSIPNTLL